MLLDLIMGGDMVDIIIGLCVSAFVVFCVLPIHEFAHGWVAYKMGDETANNQGRLTLSPFAHVDWIGAIMILLVGFGYAKPVPVNLGRVKMKNKKLAGAIIALAGPLSNLVLAFIGADVAGVTAEDAGRLVLLEDDGVVLDEYLQGVVVGNLQGTAKLDRQLETPHAVNAAHNAGGSHRKNPFRR